LNQIRQGLLDEGVDGSKGASDDRLDLGQQPTREGKVAFSPFDSY
jgi:hypothetical protein